MTTLEELAHYLTEEVPLDAGDGSLEIRNVLLTITEHLARIDYHLDRCIERLDAILSIREEGGAKAGTWLQRMAMEECLDD